MKKYILMLILLQAVYVGAWAQEKVKGRVVDTQSNEAIPGAVIKIPEKNITQIADSKGEFELNLTPGKYKITVQSLGYLTKELEIQWPLTSSLTISLQPDETLLNEVEVVNTGYQTLPKERATGSFAVVDNNILNVIPSSNILERLSVSVSGVLYDKTTGTSNNLSVRGRSTIFANTNPLIILDNFPFEGDINSINPDDIENITILKDAAAASIWGVRASNGVIVLTTKKGVFKSKNQLNFNSLVSVTEKQDLFSTAELGMSEIIELEKFLYNQGYYNSAINLARTYISPVVEILNKKDKNIISEQEANEALNLLQSKPDVRNTIENYYYRPKIDQQYNISLKGGSQNNSYYYSLGSQHLSDNLISNSSQRITLNGRNSFVVFRDKIKINTGINLSFNNSTTHNGNILNSNFIRPYSELIDGNGKHLSVPTYKQSWLDTVGRGALLNWDWVPLDELQRNTFKKNQINQLFDIDIKYEIIDGINVGLVYQYNRANLFRDDLLTQDSYQVRDYINQFSQINYSNLEVTRRVPLGGILKKSYQSSYGNNLRLQAEVDKKIWKGNFAAITGFEIKSQDIETNNFTNYGYDNLTGQIAPIDYVNPYRNFLTGGNSTISGSPTQTGISDRFISYYGNANYNFLNKYSISGSFRKDESNLFGVDANMKGVPLWSIGGSWLISNEKFFKLSWVNSLKFRMTYGYNGNVDKSISAYVTAISNSGTRNRFGDVYANLVNPPNSDLRWEKIGVFNFGSEIGFLSNNLRLTIDYYKKRGKDIIGNSPLHPSSGVTLFKGNSADLETKGVDFVLSYNSYRTNKLFLWNSILNFNVNKDEIKDYKVATTALEFKKGYPFNSIFSYRWGGLDNTNGNPLGYLNQNLSSDWAKINQIDSLGKNIIYSGSGTPQFFGGITNSITYKNLSLTINLSFKFKYFFRAPSVNYAQTFSLISTHKDYITRWKQPGDEKHTYVPSVIYPVNSSRDHFYTNSEILVQEGDHIRLQTIQLSYLFNKSKSPLSSLKCNLNLNNIGLIWKSNKLNLDPEYLNIANQKGLILGISKQF